MMQTSSNIETNSNSAVKQLFRRSFSWSQFSVDSVQTV